VIARSSLHFLFSHNIVILQVKGKVSGAIYNIPVSYLNTKHGIICMTEKKGLWWKNLRGGVDLELWLRGKEVTGFACVEEDDETAKAATLEKFCRNSRVSAYFAKVNFVQGQPVQLEIEAAARAHVVIDVKI
jgi:hypothetical protein